MCRLFGFRSIFSSKMHKSLVSADNALMLQSERHPDGWGVAYYLAGAPHIVKSASTAIEDSIFHKVSGVVTSETVLAHLRKATQGNNNILNTHPFQYGNWVFAHNGNVEFYHEKRDQILGLIAPFLRQFILGETDSEMLFYLILTHLARRVELHRSQFSFEEVSDSVRDALNEILDVTGGFCQKFEGDPTKTYLSFLLTNGVVFLAHQGGQPLYFSTHKTLCSERNVCPHFGNSCEEKRDSGFISHLLVASEPLQGENVWQEMSPGEIVGVDWRMELHKHFHV